MSLSPSSTRHLYRSIFRELSKQHNAASKLHAEKDKKRLEAIAQYQRMKNAAAGIRTDPKDLQNSFSKTPRYDSSTLREIFVNGPQDSAKGSHVEYLKTVSIFLTSQRTYKELLELYNGSLIDEDSRVHLSARRVGLELPETQ